MSNMKPEHSGELKYSEILRRMEKYLDILVRVETKVDVVNERMDRHEAKNDARFVQVFKKIDESNAKVHQVELSGAKEDGEIKINMATMSGELKTKIAGLSAGVALLMSGLSEYIKTVMSKWTGN